MKLIVATDNIDKVREFRQILTNPPFTIQSMREAGFSGVIIEDGSDYLENALIKARTVHQQTGGLVLADDSGLSIDVLDGAPGIYSARFAGESADYPTKISRLYQLLEPYPTVQWQAQFACASAAILPVQRVLTAVGIVEGFIAPESKGSRGFGYDPIFYVPKFGCTMAELEDDEKHRISHRGQALKKIASQLLDPISGA